MKQLFLMVNDGSVRLIDTPSPTVKDRTVIVETLYSAVSAGTERSLSSFGEKNLIQKAMERPDQVKKVMEKMSTDGVVTTLDSAFNKLKEPMPMGYSAVGRIISCGEGVTEVRPGDTVAMVGQAYHSEINRVGKNLIAKVPDSIADIRQIAFCALGGIALEGIHQAGVVPGETVAVIGLGLLGHITSRILNAYGCDVIGFDIADKSLPATKLISCINSNDENAADMALSLTKGRGVDKIIITAATSSNAPMDLAAAIARDRAAICMIGVTHMDIDRRPFYKKELSFKIARSYGPGRYDSSYEEDGVDYPIGHVRFTEGRNVEEFVRLIARGKLDLTDLITHVIPFENAPDAYEMITTNAQHRKYIGILLEYKGCAEGYASADEEVSSAGAGSAPEAPQDGKESLKNSEGISVTPPLHAHVYVQGPQVRLGLIGAGNFARSTMLPAMAAGGQFHFTGLATTGGIGSAQASSAHPFDYTTNDYRKLLADPDIDLIAISTQHNTHARFVIEALQAGKSVYCEKPLCLSLAELSKIEETYGGTDGELFCGLNRRYSPLVQTIKNELHTDKIPAVYTYTVNAGFIPPDHWTQDAKTGGGRIIGEACHFIDTIQALDGSELEEVRLNFARNPAYPKNDNAFLMLTFASGAIANILYTSMGSKIYPKEQLRVFSNGAVYVLDNYVQLVKYGSLKHTAVKFRQDKGIMSEYAHISAVLHGNEPNTEIGDAFASHRLLLAALGKTGADKK